MGFIVSGVHTLTYLEIINFTSFSHTILTHKPVQILMKGFVLLSKASLDTAIMYASQRIAFDKPILQMSSVQNRLAEMALKIESSRLLTWKAAELKDSNVKSTKYSSFAKWQSAETATFCAHNCIQILGAMGYMQDMKAERYYRDARITEIYGGATDIQKLVIADQLKKDYGL